MTNFNFKKSVSVGDQMEGKILASARTNIYTVVAVHEDHFEAQWRSDATGYGAPYTVKSDWMAYDGKKPIIKFSRLSHCSI